MTVSQSSLRADQPIKCYVIRGLVAGIIPFPLVSFASLRDVQFNMLWHLVIIDEIEFSSEVCRSAMAALVGSDLREALDNPGVDPRLTSKSPAASRMLRVLVEVFQSFLSIWLSRSLGKLIPCLTVVTSTFSERYSCAASSSALRKVFVQHVASDHAFLGFGPSRLGANYEQIFRKSMSESCSDFIGVQP